MKGKRKTKGNLDFPFFRAVTPWSQNVFFGRYTLGWGFWWKSGPLFVTKSVRFGRTELFFFLFLESSSWDLQSEHGFRACSSKNKGNKLDFHIFGGRATTTNLQKWRNRSNVSLQSCRLDPTDPQDRRGYFRKIWAWKTLKNWKKSRLSPDSFPFFPWV